MTPIDKTKFGPWAIVTGASSGIGAEFARQLAANGINLVLIARREHLLNDLGRDLSAKYGIDYRVLPLDLTDADFLQKIDSATRDLEIGLVISNAGAGNPGEFLRIDQPELMQVIRLNVISHMMIAHHFGRKLARRGRGGLLLIAAMGASEGLPYMANDAATKAYVISLAKGLHMELEKHGVHITVVLPGPTDTPVIDQFGFDVESMPMKPMSVEQCVTEALVALRENRTAHLTGRLNRLMIKLMPASLIRKILGTMIAKGVEKRQQTSGAIG